MAGIVFDDDVTVVRRTGYTLGRRAAEALYAAYISIGASGLRLIVTPLCDRHPCYS